MLWTARKFDAAVLVFVEIRLEGRFDDEPKISMLQIT